MTDHPLILEALDRLAVSRLGKSIMRETDKDLIVIRKLAEALKAATEPSTDEMAVARNIVNQIGDLYAERIPSPDWVPVRQATNDELDAFTARLIRGVRTGTLREAAVALDATAADLDPSRPVDLAYINCTRIDAQHLRDHADRMEKGQTDD